MTETTIGDCQHHSWDDRQTLSYVEGTMHINVSNLDMKKIQMYDASNDKQRNMTPVEHIMSTWQKNISVES